MLKKQNNENRINGEKNRNKNKKSNQIFLIKKIKLRSKKIQLLRKKKGLHIIRKKDSDTIRKKIKTYFHNYLLDLLNLMIKKIDTEMGINEYKQVISKQKSNYKKVKKFLKFNNKFTTNVSIIINRNLLSKKIRDILMNEPISSKYKAYDSKNNFYLTNYLLSVKIYSDIQHILNLKYMELYDEFIKSVNFKNILKKVKNRDGEEYMIKFKNVSENYISYFNEPKSKRIPKNEFKKNIFKKDKNKNKSKNKKDMLNIKRYNSNKYLKNNLNNNEFQDCNFKEIYEFPSISYLNNDISLIEDGHDFFDNSFYYNFFEEKRMNESKTKLINDMDEINSKLFKPIINIDFEKISEKNCNKNIYDFKDISFFTENENNNSFDSNNLSYIKDEDKFKKYINDDDCQSIKKKQTCDSSKTNETDYTPK